LEELGFYGRGSLLSGAGYHYYAEEATAGPPLDLGAGLAPERAEGRSPTPRPEGMRVEMTLRQACPPEYWRAQCAFKDSMVH
jgi:hypothetical protein